MLLAVLAGYYAQSRRLLLLGLGSGWLQQVSGGSGGAEACESVYQRSQRSFALALIILTN